MRSILVMGLVSAIPLIAQDPIDSPAFQHFYNLEYDEAIAALDKAVALQPDSANLHNHIAQCIQFREMFRVGALESELVSGNNSFLRRPKIDTTPEVEKRFMDELQKAMSLSQARLDKNPDDTQALYSLGVAYGLRGNWNFLVRKAWREALRDATTARKLHNRVTQLDPNNWDARLVQGAYDYVAGSLPALYRMLGFLAGFRGDKERGIRTLEQVAKNGRYNRIDAEIFLCALYRREQRWQAAAPLLDDLVRRFPRNYLMTFEQAQMYSSIGNKDKAIAALEQVAECKRQGAQGYAKLPWEQIYYHMGNIHFWYREYDQALENLRKATAGANELDLNTGALAWMRMGQSYDMTNRRNLAVEAYKKSIAFAPAADAARESRRYLSSPYRREKG